MAGSRQPRRQVGWAALVAGAALAVGCTTDIRGQPGRSGVVVTYRAPGLAFGGYPTFALTSRVGLATDIQGGKVFAGAPGLLAAVATQLQARGFTKAEDLDPATPPASPPTSDLLVNVTALDVAGTQAGYWSAYGGYSQPADFGLPGFAWAYPWPWVTVPFEPGTVLVEIADLRDRVPGSGGPGQIAVAWAALAYGVAPGGPYDSAAVLAAVERAFEQSAYLAVP